MKNYYSFLLQYSSFSCFVQVKKKGIYCKNGSALKLLVSHLTLTLYKLDTSLIWTARDSPEGVHLKESWLYWLWNTVKKVSFTASMY